MDQIELARVAGVDAKTVRSLEKGDRWPRDSTRAKIEVALGWLPGSLEAITEGQDPTPLPRSQPPLPGMSGDWLGHHRDEKNAARSRGTKSADKAVRNLLVHHMRDVPPGLVERFSHNPQETADSITYLLDTLKDSFALAVRALELGAAPVEVERYLDGAMGILITSGVLGLAGQSTDGSVMQDMLTSFGQVKAVLREAAVRQERASTRSTDSYDDTP
ncbi:hypothetical protein GS966_20210 [Rhodococcus hoagii]|nr:hypothetical protein [Prescottella equi]NKS73473.1 hypothetical protein [Prescottella equi]NKS73499.1 hypothetical protein [Prescottella equi]NKZ92252.1 hypothetical protein [Prescottella equi]